MGRRLYRHRETQLSRCISCYRSDGCHHRVLQEVGGRVSAVNLDEAAHRRWACEGHDVDLQIRLRAFPQPGPPQSVMVDTGAGRFGPLTVGTEWQTLVVAIPRVAWRAGANQVVLTYSRVGRPSSTGGTVRR